MKPTDKKTKKKDPFDLKTMGTLQSFETTEGIPTPTQPGTLPDPTPIAKPDKKVIA